MSTKQMKQILVALFGQYEKETRFSPLFQNGNTLCFSSIFITSPSPLDFIFLCECVSVSVKVYMVFPALSFFMFSEGQFFFQKETKCTR